jgi:hypothetical protein
MGESSPGPGEICPVCISPLIPVALLPNPTIGGVFSMAYIPLFEIHGAWNEKEFCKIEAII